MIGNYAQKQEENSTHTNAVNDHTSATIVGHTGASSAPSARAPWIIASPTTIVTWPPDMSSVSKRFVSLEDYHV